MTVYMIRGIYAWVFIAYQSVSRKKKIITVYLLIFHDKLHEPMHMRAYCRSPIIVVMLVLQIFRITLSIVYTLRMHPRMSSVQSDNRHTHINVIFIKHYFKILVMCVSSNSFSGNR